MSGMFDDLMDTAVAPEPEKVEQTDGETTESDKVEENTDAGAESASDSTDPKGDKPTPEPRKTLEVESISQLPTGFVDVRGFAWALTQRAVKAAVEAGREPGPDDMVDTQAVYAATRGVRWSLPSLEAVTADGTKLGVVIPLNEGLEAWDARPERGAGSTGGATMTPERKATRILRAGKFKAQLEKMNKRYARITQLLNEVGATWEDADKAYDEWLETEEGKNAIADDEKKDKKNGDE